MKSRAQLGVLQVAAGSSPAFSTVLVLCPSGQVLLPRTPKLCLTHAPPSPQYHPSPGRTSLWLQARFWLRMLESCPPRVVKTVVPNKLFKNFLDQEKEDVKLRALAFQVERPRPMVMMGGCQGTGLGEQKQKKGPSPTCPHCQ